jgi:hypothetical protein
MTHTGKSAGQHNDNNNKDVMGYALPRRENEPVPVGLAVRDTLDSPFKQEPKPAEKANASNKLEEQQQHHDFANAWDMLSAFSAWGRCDVTIDTAVHRLQGLGLRRGLVVLTVDQPPFKGGGA